MTLKKLFESMNDAAKKMILGKESEPVKDNDETKEIEPVEETKTEDEKSEEQKPVDEKISDVPPENAQPENTDEKPADETGGDDAAAEPAETVDGEPAATVTDPRAEFKSFMAEFGAERAAQYFSEGLDMATAFARFMAELKTENENLKNKLSAAVVLGDSNGCTETIPVAENENQVDAMAVKKWGPGMAAMIAKFEKQIKQ